jgi:hypothetical protein
MDEQSQNNPKGMIPAGQLPPGVEIIQHGRKLHMYQVTSTELDTLQDAGNYKTLDIAMFALSVGIFVTTACVLSTTSGMGDRALFSFSAACIISLLATLFFGVRAVIAWKKAAREYQKITAHQA